MTCDARNSVAIAVTGGIACGKSTAGRILEEMGFALCDTDAVAHRLMKKGEAVYNRVVSHFGKDILAEDGEIDRSVLGAVVFKNHSERDVLNALVHPAVKEQVACWVAEQKERGCSAAVQVPLLFESGMTGVWDAVVCVSADREHVEERLSERGLSAGEIESRITAQWPLSKKEQYSDYVIRNNGTIEELRQQLKQIVLNVMAERKDR